MYRSAAKRLLPALSSCRTGHSFQIQPSNIRAVSIIKSPEFSTSSASDTIPNQNLNFSESTSSSSTTSTASAEEEIRARAHDGRSARTASATAHYEEEQARVLNAALQHVVRLGWTDAAMVAGARDVGVSPSIVGSFSRKEAALVEFFMDECLQRLIDIIDAGEDLKNLTPSERIAKLLRIRLEMQAPYISKWPQALSIQAHPLNVATIFKQRAMLMDEIWHAVGDDGSDIDWYVKRTVLGGIYSAAELYMLTDTSPDFRDTWTFLLERIRDAFDLKKTAQEAKYLAETVGAGMGSSLQGFIKTVLRF